MTRFNATLILIFICLACSKTVIQNTSGSFKGMSQVDFCDLPKYEGQLVYFKATYSGMDEYWALNSLKRCEVRLNVELDDRSGTSIPSRFKKAFDSAYSSYWNTYLIVEGTGIFESKNAGGYGHLGSNKARLIMKDYINVTVVKKGKP